MEVLILEKKVSILQVETPLILKKNKILLNFKAVSNSIMAAQKHKIFGISEHLLPLLS